ncbi:MAG: flagellin, partial [bacterium]
EFQAKYGIMERRLEHIVDELSQNIVDLRGANSKIEDTNMAVEISRFTKNQIMQMGSLAASAYANNMPATALQLISEHGIGGGGAF